jgi:asparagine synthase (glutamine-hydrolysing)
MPGLIGILPISPPGELGPLYQRLSAPMRRSTAWPTESLVDPNQGWGLGRVHLGFLQPAPQLVPGQSLQILFHGSLDNAEDLRLHLSDGTPPPDALIPLLTALYRCHGKACVGRLQGSFCLAILDLEAKHLILASDRFGSYPLYWHHSPGGLLFASELRALLHHPACKPTLNRRAVADYVTMGFPLGEKTLVEGVYLLPSGSTLLYQWQDSTVRLERYHRVADLFQPWTGTQPEYYEEIGGAFRRAVGRSLAGGHRVGLSLSGGLDSRAILSAIDARNHPISTFTLGIKGCADQVIAEKLARLAGTDHHFFELTEEYLVDFLPQLQRMVSLSDGMYLSHGLTEMLALRFLEQIGPQMLLRGHGAELAKTHLAWPLHTDERIKQITDKGAFLDYLAERVNYISRGIPLARLFTKEWADAGAGGARRSLEESVAQILLAPLDLCSYLYLEEHHRRFTIGSLELFRNITEVRVPFVDREFLGVLFRAPAAWRAGTDIHRALIRRNNPALLRVRNSNTGAAADAGPLQEKILDKVNTLFKRCNVWGYRHYHNFDGWMRRMLMQSVEEVILAPEALARGIFEEKALRQLVQGTREGTVKGAYLLQVLLILELWQRENGVRP